MENKKEIAEKKAKEVMDWYNQESKKISAKYGDIPGMDNGAEEQKRLTQQAYEKVQKIKKEYGID